MDIFEQHMFEELTMEYAKDNLTKDDYEELYVRFCNMDYLKEVQPYLYTMRFYGLGTVSEKEIVLKELKESISETDYILKGLYYDLLVSEDDSNTSNLENLYKMIDKGYTNKFTKENSYIGKIQSKNKNECIDEQIVIKSITFECKNYNGLYFTTGDTDYLNALVYIKPIQGKKHIKVSSQIFLHDEAFSEIFYNEYDIDSNTTYFRTLGLGNKECNCYGENTYKWVIKIDEQDVFSKEFYMYAGKLDQRGPKVNDVKLFASKFDGILGVDRNNYKTMFDSETLECLYFKFLICEPGRWMNIQIFIKVTYYEDNSVFSDTYSLTRLRYDSVEFWSGVGFSEPGKWKKGLYQYSVRIGRGVAYEGAFTVY